MYLGLFSFSVFKYCVGFGLCGGVGMWVGFFRVVGDGGGVFFYIVKVWKGRIMVLWVFICVRFEYCFIL